VRYQTPVALSRVPSAIFRRMRASPGGPYTEYAPAGTPHASARKLTLGVVCLHRWPIWCYTPTAA
jgi:hypothetical protein